MLQKIFAITMLLFFITGLGALLPLKASADEIIMDNGVRLKGTVTNLAGDLLSLTSDYSESIKLKTSKIIGISTDIPS